MQGGTGLFSASVHSGLGSLFLATTRLIEFTCRTSQVRVRARVKYEPSSSQDPTFIFIFFSLLFISSDRYSRNDLQVANGKIHFQVCNIFHCRSLEPFNTAVERYATSLSVHACNFPKKIKTCSCIDLKQRYHFHD